MVDFRKEIRCWLCALVSYQRVFIEQLLLFLSQNHLIICVLTVYELEDTTCLK